MFRFPSQLCNRAFVTATIRNGCGLLNVSRRSSGVGDIGEPVEILAIPDRFGDDIERGVMGPQSDRLKEGRGHICHVHEGNEVRTVPGHDFFAILDPLKRCRLERSGSDKPATAEDAPIEVRGVDCPYHRFHY